MSNNSTIEWTDATWNPVTGCTKVGPGCDHCYAEVFAERWRGVTGHHFEQGFDLKLWPHRLDYPTKWKKPRRIFVNSMSDMFHKGIPFEYIDQIFDTMEAVDRHVYQILTKRSSIMEKYIKHRYGKNKVPSHIWLGVSVEDDDHKGRIKHLQRIKTHSRFISFEPLLGPIGHVNLEGIAWAIVGGESGNRCRPMEEAWALELRDKCENAGTEFFFKQWGGRYPKSGGRLLDGELYDGLPWHLMPNDLKVITRAKF